MTEYKVIKYENTSSFEKGLNDMSHDGYELHSFIKYEGMFYSYTAVFYKKDYNNSIQQ